MDRFKRLTVGCVNVQDTRLRLVWVRYKTPQLALPLQFTGFDVKLPPVSIVLPWRMSTRRSSKQGTVGIPASERGMENCGQMKHRQGS